MSLNPIEQVITLTREEFLFLVILNGSVKTTSTEGHIITINGASEHVKYGLSGTEDGSYHFFHTYVLYGGKEVRGHANLASFDDGLNYRGVLFFNFPNSKNDLV